MKAIEKNIYSRNGYFYYRKFIPRKLFSIMPYKEIWLGLDTQDLTTARLNTVKLDYEITGKLRTLETGLHDLSPEESPNRLVHKCVSEIEEIKTNYGYKPRPLYSLHNSKQGEALSFSTIVQAYLDDCPADAHSTREHKESTYQLFEDIMGDLPANRINKTHARTFKSRLLKMPANAKRVWGVNDFKNIDWSKVKTDKPQAARTINSRISYLIVLFNWAINADYYHGDNPFKGLMINKSQKSTKARRHPFKQEELQVLFKTGLGKGIENKLLNKPSTLWIPLIGLYSGMRLNEICQLYTSDIRKEDGVWVFDINDGGKDKALKTASSRRIIPIHNAIIDHGLMTYLKEIESQGHKRLFPDVPMGKSAKNYSSTFTKRFWRLLKELEIKRDGLCFHSLRHTFIDGMRNTGVERSIVMTITGHQSGKDVHDAYGYGYNLKILQENINKLQFNTN